MAKLLIYVFPMLIDMALGGVWVLCGLRRAEVLGASASDVTWLMVLWAGTYMVVTRLIGTILTDRNALGLVLAGSLSVSVVAAGFILVPAVEHMRWLLMLQAVATALFFVPFQVFMKQVAGGGKSGIVRPTALYTASWSLGFAFGPFVAVWLWHLVGWRWSYGVNIVIGLVTFVGILLLRRVGDAPPAETAERPAAADRYAGMPDFAWLAWVGCGAAFVAISAIRSLLPMATDGGMTPVGGVTRTDVGMILATMALAHSIAAVTLLRSRFWMYRPAAIVGFALFGLAGLVLFATAGHLASYYVAAVCYGIYSATFSFYFVFHALVHPSKSPVYISTNEAVVGLASIIGPLGGGWIADATGVLAAPFWCAAGLLTLAVAVQAIVHARHAGALPQAAR